MRKSEYDSTTLEPQAPTKFGLWRVTYLQPDGKAAQRCLYFVSTTSQIQNEVDKFSTHPSLRHYTLTLVNDNVTPPKIIHVRDSKPIYENALVAGIDRAKELGYLLK